MKYAVGLVLLVSTIGAMDNKRLKGTNSAKAMHKTQLSLNESPLRHKTTGKMPIKSETLIDTMGMLALGDDDYLRTTKSDEANILPVPAKQEVNS